MSEWWESRRLAKLNRKINAVHDLMEAHQQRLYDLRKEMEKLKEMRQHQERIFQLT